MGHKWYGGMMQLLSQCTTMARVKYIVGTNFIQEMIYKGQLSNDWLCEGEVIRVRIHDTHGERGTIINAERFGTEP